MEFNGGTQCYQVDSGPVLAHGRTYTEDELTAALDGRVSELIRDDVGNETVKESLVGIAETGFEHKNIDRILSHERIPEDWRVGEAFAESYLCDHRACLFPWPSGRDQKNPESSLPGADLVGFQDTDQGALPNRFAFGEVKTSDQERWPPQVMYGRHGMISQLESLRDDVDVRDHLVKYLAHRAPRSAWEPQFRQAAGRYLTDSTDVALFGVLVRDVEPQDKDLRNRAKALASGCPAQMSIELIAVYFPSKSITDIGLRIRLRKEGRHDDN